jgi:hypothetical protein
MKIEILSLLFNRAAHEHRPIRLDAFHDCDTTHDHDFLVQNYRPDLVENERSELSLAAVDLP